MARKDSPFLNRYALTPETFKAIKKDLRRIHKGAGALLERKETHQDKELRDYLKEVQRLTLMDLEALRTETKQIK